MERYTPLQFRRRLHARPELSFEEHATAAFIEEALDAWGIPHRRIARTGVLATLEGGLGSGAAAGGAAGRCAERKAPCVGESMQEASAGPQAAKTAAQSRGRAVVLRADIDALPILERTGLECASEHEGVMHACGHDIHAAVVYGVLTSLAADPSFEGTVLGLFQPGEECNPGGASLVLAEDPFAGYEVAAVAGEHVESGLEVGTIGLRAGRYMAASDELHIRVRGCGGHAALRSQLRDPVAAGADLATRLLALNDEQTVLSLGRFEAAGATNVVPDEAVLEGTLRTFDERVRARLHRRIGRIARGVDARHGVVTEAAIDRGYPPVVNDEGLVALAAELAAARDLRCEMLPLRPTAEDFGFYCARYPALFYRLGVGSAAGRPHTATFSPDEGAIDVGIGFMRSLALQILKQ